MNIKNFLGINPIATPIGQTGKVERQIKSESSHDRDAAGQYFQQKKQKKKEKMTPEQYEKALEILKQKAFVTEMNWLVLPFEENECKYAWIQEADGNTIRKISEFDLWELFEENTQPASKGQLLKRTA
ncbi:MAG: hypothetical protein H7061_02725 [Bdellovibrionaceae bacterium]|nr:hypothetical protein [Bdellovibrio sp.]